MPSTKNDWSLKVLLVAVGALCAANLVYMSGAGAPRVAQAAGIPDSGAQMEAMIDELKGMNTRLDAMQKLLSSGTLTVVAKIEKESK